MIPNLSPSKLVSGRRGGSPGRTIVLIAALLIVFLGTAALGAAEPQAPPEPFAQVVEHKLANGLTVLLLKESRAPLVTIQVWYRVGSINEALGRTGLSHLTEHLMFKGTEKYGPKTFSRLVQKAGGSDNAFTSRDYTGYFEIGPKSELKRWLEMEADRMTGLKVAEDAFTTEQKVVLEERRLRTDDDPVSSLVEETMAMAFKAHPYEWPIIGWFEDIKSLTRQDFLKHYQTYYRPNNCTLVVVGDIEPPEVIKQVEATFGVLPRGPEPPKVTAQEPPQRGERRVMLHREAQLPFVIMAYHAPNYEDKDAYALELLSLILAQGRSSRLYHDLVYTQRLALDVGADYDMHSISPGVFTIYGQPLPGKTAAEVEDALEVEVARLQSEPVSEGELAKAKNQTEAGFYMSMDSIYFRGRLLGQLATVAKWTLIREFIPQIRRVTREDVQRVARKYLAKDNRTVGILRPIKTGKPGPEKYRPGGQID
jgi:zinc protease